MIVPSPFASLDGMLQLPLILYSATTELTSGPSLSTFRGGAAESASTEVASTVVSFAPDGIGIPSPLILM